MFCSPGEVKMSFFAAEGNRTLDMSSDIPAGENHSDTKDIGCTAKRLLPLLDAIETESVERELNEMEINKQPTRMINNLFNGSELESNEHSLQNELYHVYQRLQALEADSEFVKHCLCSMKKGDKGLVLLQEILQHICDLKSVELCARNFSESPET